ncbi:MAG: ATP-binding protein [Actinomycetota bacterium]
MSGSTQSWSAPAAWSDERYREFPMRFESPRAARKLVREALETWATDDIIDDVSYVTSELASNAIRHAKSGFGLTISISDGAIRVEVEDESQSPPIPKMPNVARVGGHGLQLVSVLASEWGYERFPSGKIVWAHFFTPTEISVVE